MGSEVSSLNDPRPHYESVNGQAAAAELSAHAFTQLGVRRLGLLERVDETELVPLVTAHLVEAQHLDAFQRLQSGADVRHLLHVVVAIGQAGHEHESRPYGTAKR